MGRRGPSADFRRNRVLGGSWIHVGLGAEPVEKDARLFAWDCGRQKRVADFVPVPGQGKIQNILLLPDGTVLAACGNILVHANIEKKKLLRTALWAGGAITGLISYKNRIYINSGKGLFLFDLRGWKVVKLARGGNQLAFDKQGHAYYARGPELFRVTALRTVSPPWAKTD